MKVFYVNAIFIVHKYTLTSLEKKGTSTLVQAISSNPLCLTRVWMELLYDIFYDRKNDFIMNDVVRCYWMPHLWTSCSATIYQFTSWLCLSTHLTLASQLSNSEGSFKRKFLTAIAISLANHLLVDKIASSQSADTTDKMGTRAVKKEMNVGYARCWCRWPRDR